MPCQTLSQKILFNLGEFAQYKKKLPVSSQRHQQVNPKLLRLLCLLKTSNAEMFSCHWKLSCSCFLFSALLRNSQFLLGRFRKLVRHQIMLWLHCFAYEIKAWAVFRIPKSRIPDSTSQKFSDSGIRIPLTWGYPPCAIIRFRYTRNS